MDAIAGLGDGPKDMLGSGGIALLKHEHRQSELPEIVREGNQLILLLLAGVTDEDECRDFEQIGLALGVGQNLTDLRVPGAAVDPGHKTGEVIGFRDPFRGAALAPVPVIDQRPAEPADAGDRLKHVALQLTGHIPGLLPTGGGVEREDEAARYGRLLVHLQVDEEGVDLEAGTGGSWSLFGHENTRSACGVRWLGGSLSYTPRILVFPCRDS